MFEVGQDVLVMFRGEECRGEVLDCSSGWVLTRVLIDPVTDWGDISPMLDPQPLAMVRESNVRAVE